MSLNNKYITENELYQIIKNGRIYNPAYTHYTTNPNEGNISCDKCKKNSLNVSFGYMDKDLCINCYNYCKKYFESRNSINPINPVNPYPNVQTRMMISDFNQDSFPNIRTKMRISDFNPDSFPQTLMMISSLRSKKKIDDNLTTYMCTSMYDPDFNNFGK